MALPIRVNSRQIPKSREYTMDKRYNDLVYGYLQSISYPESMGYRYIEKSEFNFTKAGKALGMTRQTMSKWFNLLRDMKLVVEEDRRYALQPLAEDYALLVPNDVLEKLVSFKKQHLISMYTYFLWRYTKVYAPYDYLVSTVKEFIGISKNTYNNSYIINDNLEILIGLGLIGWKQWTHEEGTTYQTKSTILWVKNTL